MKDAGKWSVCVRTEDEPVIPEHTVALPLRSDCLVNTGLAGFIQRVHADGFLRCGRRGHVQDPCGLCRSMR